VLWRYKKNRVYPLAKFSPLMFNHTIKEEKFIVFQTLEVTDFKNALSKYNIDLLIKESGLFIAHTYFSAPMVYHHGKLFYKENKIDLEVDKRFQYLSEKIQSKNIWNPTLHELIEYLNKVNQIFYDCNEDGEIFILDENKLVFREVR